MRHQIDEKLEAPVRAPWGRGWFVYALLLLVTVRFYHLRAPLDEPHSWRQADTANYALDLYLHTLDVLHPMVCWQGAKPVVILEFPGYEAVVAGLYRLVGENLAVARGVTIAFWLGSLLYLYLLVAMIDDRRLARASALVYATLPLGIYFSRAVHIDFATLFAALGMLYHFLRALVRGRYLELIPGAVLGALAFAMKAPYAFFLYLPLAYCVVRDRQLLRAIMALPFLALPVAVFWAWRGHVAAVNGQAPDLSFIPGYFKLVDMSSWYFGTLSQRLDVGNWLELARRLVGETFTPVGTVLALLGLRWSAARWRQNAFAEVWALGAAGYLLIFFNVNLVHNYYQIPLLAVASIFIARGLVGLWELEPRAILCTALRERLPRAAMLSSASIRTTLVTGAALALAGNAAFVALRSYYRVDWLRVEAGRQIEANTPEDALVIASIEGTDPRDPRLLYRAHRHGFSIEASDLTPLLVSRLRDEGATTLAVVQAAGAEGTPPGLISSLTYQTLPLEHDGQPLGWLYLASLTHSP